MFARLALSNVWKSVRDFSVYFLTVMLGVAVFYAFNSMTQQQSVLAFSETQNRLFELLGMVIGGVSVFIAIVLVFLVVYANRFLIRRRKKEFGLYLMLGMSTADVVKIVVMESLMVGAASLMAGLALGFGLSQLLLYVTSLLFQTGVADASGFAFIVSAEALTQTLAVFLVVFVLAALLNARTVVRTRLVDLMGAESKHETMKLRSLPLSLVLFVLALVIIGVSYKLLTDNGLMNISPEFGLAAVLVCVGTVLFFYALSGFLLKLVQMIRPLYLRGLNMFTLRQLNAKVNTTFASLSIVCLTLFLAITSVCGGIGIRNTLEANLESSMSYSASVRTVFATLSSSQGLVPEDLGTSGTYAAGINFDMEQGLRHSAQMLGAGDLDALVSSCSQIDFRSDAVDPLTIGDFEAASGASLADEADGSINPDYGRNPLYLASLSQVNAALELAGKSPIELAADECVILGDSDITRSFFERACVGRPELSVGGGVLVVREYVSAYLETTSFPLNTGAVVVPDVAMPAGATILFSTFDVQCVSDEDEAAFGEMCAAVADSTEPNTWPVTLVQTRTSVAEQSIGLSSVIAYLAVYLGFVLVIACAAILAIQQLSDASDNAQRYALLRKLGAPSGMVNTALFVQVLVYFLFPLLLALAHAACALVVVTDVVAVFGHLDIGAMALTCAGAFLVTYGVYFVATYLGARRMVGD